MLNLLDLELSGIHGVFTSEDGTNEVVHLLKEFFIRHDCNDLLIIRLIQAAIVLILVWGGRAHELVSLQLHFVGYLRDDGTLDEA